MDVLLGVTTCYYVILGVTKESLPKLMLYAADSQEENVQISTYSSIGKDKKYGSINVKLH